MGGEYFGAGLGGAAAVSHHGAAGVVVRISDQISTSGWWRAIIPSQQNLTLRADAPELQVQEGNFHIIEGMLECPRRRGHRVPDFYQNHPSAVLPCTGPFAMKKYFVCGLLAGLVNNAKPHEYRTKPVVR